ncbi:hypothetical protein [Streptomyces sp. C36]|uniref:DUF7848 domain-containing protein n=1 Tax=Streptomyces sp. C36 TaxID=3237122 RepID=UPI0034C67829
MLFHGRWFLTPDTEPDARPLTHARTCVVCMEEIADQDRDPVKAGAQSPADVSSEATQRWVFGHLAKHPGHLTYDVIISRLYRAYLAGRADGEPM